MLVSERKPLTRELSQEDKFSSFGEAMPDGRLTEQQPMKLYRMREAFLLSKQLGRPLSAEEMQAFEVKN